MQTLFGARRGLERLAATSSTAALLVAGVVVGAKLLTLRPRGATA